MKATVLLILWLAGLGCIAVAAIDLAFRGADLVRSLALFAVGGGLLLIGRPDGHT